MNQELEKLMEPRTDLNPPPLENKITYSPDGKLESFTFQKSWSCDWDQWIIKKFKKWFGKG